MTGTAEVQAGALLHVTRLLVQNEEVVGDDSANFVFTALATDQVDFVLHLNRGKRLGKQVRVCYLDCCRVLSGQIMNHHGRSILIKIMQSGLLRLQNEVRLETDDILQKPSKLINFTQYLNLWPRILSHISLMFI